MEYISSYTYARQVKRMTNYIEYLDIPTKVGVVIVAMFLVIQIIGEILEFKGKVVPEIMKVRKYFARKKQERQVLRQAPMIIQKFQQTLDEFNSHYSKDNIMTRDQWIKDVNKHILDSDKKKKEQDKWMQELNKKLDKNNCVTLSILIENKRSAIIDFASKVINEDYPVTKEQFNRIFKVYEEYECIIEENGLTNGEVDIAIRIIRESYEQHLKNHTFIEDVRGYEVN